MSIAARHLVSILLTTALVACSNKPAATSPDAPAAAGSASVAASAGVSAGSYQGVAIFPGMTELMTHDTPAEGGALHSGSYSSTAKLDDIRAFYHQELAKLSGSPDKVGDDQPSEGMYRLIGGSEGKMVTILIHPGDSGQQIVGIQVLSKN